MGSVGFIVGEEIREVIVGRDVDLDDMVGFVNLHAVDERESVVPDVVEVLERGMVVDELALNIASHLPPCESTRARRDCAQIHRHRGRKLLVPHLSAEHLKSDQQTSVIVDDPGLCGGNSEIPGRAMPLVADEKSEREGHRRLNLWRKRIVAIHIPLQEVFHLEACFGHYCDWRRIEGNSYLHAVFYVRELAADQKYCGYRRRCIPGRNNGPFHPPGRTRRKNSRPINGRHPGHVRRRYAEHFFSVMHIRIPKVQRDVDAP
jgi:hypothetical protein